MKNINTNNKKLLVIGDSCIDKFIYGRCNRLCPEGPVPVLISLKVKISDGMSANVYRNILSLLHNDKTQVTFITNKLKATKIRYIEEKSNQLLLRVDLNDEVDAIVDLKTLDLTEYDLIVISDYNKGFLSVEDIRYICENHPMVFIDTKKILSDFCIKARFIKINQYEYARVEDFIDKTLFDHNLIVTLGGEGCRYKNKVYSGKNVEIKDIAGAGDTFLAALVVKYLTTEDIEQSLIFANECAAKLIQLRGVTVID